MVPSRAPSQNEEPETDDFTVRTEDILNAEEDLIPEMEDLRNIIGDVDEEDIFNARLDEYLADCNDNKDQGEILEHLKVDENSPDGFIVGIQEPAWNTHTQSISHLRGHYILLTNQQNQNQEQQFMHQTTLTYGLYQNILPRTWSQSYG